MKTDTGKYCASCKAAGKKSRGAGGAAGVGRAAEAAGEDPTSGGSGGSERGRDSVAPAPAGAEEHARQLAERTAHGTHPLQLHPAFHYGM